MVIDLGDIASALAIVLSVGSMVQTHKFNQKQKKFEETSERLNLILIEKETNEKQSQLRAEISANFVKMGRSERRLKVFNKGKATARNVHLEIMDEGGLISKSDIDRKFPIPLLEQYQSVDLLVMTHLNSPSRAHIKLTWDDEYGHAITKELYPTL